jgi:hypothetical protein
LRYVGPPADNPPRSFFTAYAVFSEPHLARQISALTPVQLAVGALLLAPVAHRAQPSSPLSALTAARTTAIPPYGSTGTRVQPATQGEESRSSGDESHQQSSRNAQPSSLNLPRCVGYKASGRLLSPSSSVFRSVWLPSAQSACPKSEAGSRAGAPPHELKVAGGGGARDGAAPHPPTRSGSDRTVRCP